MRKNLTGKTVAILAILVVFVYGIFFGMHAPKSGSPKSLIADNIHLGLDLRGGTHLVLQVMVNEAVAAVTDNDVERIQDDLKKANLTVGSVAKLDPAHPEVITVSGTAPDKSSDVRSLLESNYGATYDTSLAPDNSWVLNMKHQSLLDLQKHAVTQSIETIRDRVDTLGVSEPVIQEYGLGENEILVELPGLDDPVAVRNAIQSTSRLEIHEVIGNTGYNSEADALQANGGALPPDEEMLHGSSTGQGQDQVWVIKRVSVVAGNDFRDAQPSQDENGRPDISFNLTSAGGDKFYAYTSANVGKMMAIVLNNRVRSAANIQSAIRDSGRLTGSFGEQEAQDLSLTLRTGSLPASLQFREERTVGPSLGAASIRHGVTAAIAGMLAVMVFMLIYYRGAGINADLALFLNLVILLGFMGFVGATLTLPGIAGVILTIGMGVDSNVLIFERIREELHLGKSAVSAVDQGFAHAWITIIDTHVTTIVSAAILFLFGTGPVQGFAVTLTFGLIANLFTAVFVSRVIFDSILERKERGAALSI
jgi:preprotein translocase subunit SecD